MITFATIIIPMLNILKNHTMLTRRRSIPYCVIAFFLNSLFLTIVSRYLKNIITDPIIFKYVFYFLASSYIVYISIVFSEPFSVKLFSMFNVWVYSTIIISISSMIYDIAGNYTVSPYIINSARVILHLILLGIFYIWYGGYFKRIVGKINSGVTYLMSGYMFLALIMLISSTSLKNQIVANNISIVEMLFLVCFIVLGNLIVFFGVSSASKNALLNQSMNDLQKQSDIYYKLANYDSLTGIANRQNILTYISETLNDNQNTNEKFTIFIFDIDKFKYINDGYGHLVGDKALKYLVKRVENCLREDDSFGRLGGDEFVIFPKNIKTKTDAESLIKRIVTALETPLKIDEDLIPINISIGVSVFPTDARLMDDLIELADQAMYKAKERVGTTYEFFSDLEKHS